MLQSNIFTKKNPVPNSGGKSDPTMEYNMSTSAISSQLETLTNETIAIQHHYCPLNMASKRKVTIMDEKISTTVTDLETRAKAKHAIEILENGAEGTLSSCTSGGSSTNPSGTTLTFHSIMTSYSALVTQLLERLANFEKLQLDALDKASSMSTIILAHQQEIQALKLALSTVRREEAKKVMAEVNEELKVKCEEAELKSIELRFEKAGLEAANKKLEKHNKLLKDVVTRFEHLYGNINDAEAADGDA
jgi:hypothetical protein